MPKLVKYYEGTQYEYEVEVKEDDPRFVDARTAGFSHSQAMYLVKLLMRIGRIEASNG